MKSKFLISVLTIMLLAGCANIASDSKYPVLIQSTPSEASFLVKDRNGVEVYSGETPDIVTLKSGGGYFKRGIYTIVIRKDGFEDETLTLRGKMDGWYWGNFGFGGTIGLLIVDPLTGAMWKLPPVFSVSLKEKIASSNTSADLKVISIHDVPKSDISKLIRIN